MGFLDRFRSKTIVVKAHNSDLTDVTGDSELDRSSLSADAEHNSVIPSFQNNLTRKIEYSNYAHRWLHTRANPFANSHTFGLVDALFYHQPFPFKYVKNDEDDVLAAKADKSKDPLQKSWLKLDMFQQFKELQAQAGGVGMACIVRITEEKFLIFNTAHVDPDNFKRDPVTRDITEIWFNWVGSAGGKDNSEELVVHAIINVNAVIFIPHPEAESPFGRSDLMRIWSTLIKRELNRYYGMQFNKKGGINGRMLIGPDSMSAASKKIFKREALKGLESELIEIYYPKALVTSNIDPSKIVQWIENPGGPGVAYDKLDAIFANDSPLPPSFVEGPASGAMGGKAPIEDAKRINRFLMGYMGRVQKLVRDINKVFFNEDTSEYMIVPYFQEEATPSSVSGQAQATEQGKKKADMDKTKDDQEAKKASSVEVEFTRSTVKSNSADSEIVMYVGNLWEAGVYKYKDWDFWTGKEIEYFQNLAGSEIQKFIEDPLSVREVYLSIEHPGIVRKSNAIGKLKVTGYKLNARGNLVDVTELSINKEWDPGYDTIKLSPVFEAHIKSLGTKYKGKAIDDQVDIALLNAGLVHYPRSALTDLSTTAQRQSV